MYSSHAFSSNTGNNIYADKHFIQKLFYKPRHHRTFLEKHHRLIVNVLAPVVILIAMLAVVKDVFENFFVFMKANPALPEIIGILLFGTLLLSIAIGSNIGV